jgi:uncharacterized integral membrane protein
MSAQPAPKPGSTAQTPKRERRSTRETARAGGMAVVAVVFVVFAVLNLNEVEVDWILGSGRAPLIVVIAISLLAGIVLTYSAERLRRRRRD